MASQYENDLSDDEIFFGKMTIKEVKKRIQMDLRRHSVPRHSTKEDIDNKTEDIVKIIEVCSEPDLKKLSPFNESFSSFSCEFKGATSKWNIDSTNNSFVIMEKLVSEVDTFSTDGQKGFNNTQDVVDYVLDNALSIKEQISQNKTADINNSTSHILDVENMEGLKLKVQNISLTEDEEKFKVLNNEKVTVKSTPNHSTKCLSKNSSQNQAITSTGCLIKEIPNKTGALLTQKIENFKTPKDYKSLKKLNYFTPHKTPSKTYKNIESPVALYIKSTTQTSAIKNFKSTKTLQAASSIPKLLGTNKIKANKENINLSYNTNKCSKNVKAINNTAIGRGETKGKTLWKKLFNQNKILPSLSKSKIDSKPYSEKEN